MRDWSRERVGVLLELTKRVGEMEVQETLKEDCGEIMRWRERECVCVCMCVWERERERFCRDRANKCIMWEGFTSNRNTMRAREEERERESERETSRTRRSPDVNSFSVTVFERFLSSICRCEVNTHSNGVGEVNEGRNKREKEMRERKWERYSNEIELYLHKRPSIVLRVFWANLLPNHWTEEI